MEAINEVIEVECKGKYFKVNVMEEQMLINTILRTECSCSGCRIEDQKKEKMEEVKEQVAETEGPSKPNLEQVDDNVEIVPDTHEEKDTGDGTISKQNNGKLVFLGNIRSSQVQNPLQLGAFTAEKEPLRDSMNSCHGISKAWGRKKEKRGNLKKTLRESNIDMLFIQESKQKCITKEFLSSLWWDEEFVNFILLKGDVLVLLRWPSAVLGVGCWLSLMFLGSESAGSRRSSGSSGAVSAVMVVVLIGFGLGVLGLAHS
ncbi:hypothetical protein RHMOL_Rhmol01G0060400 [Rhododendron molle]|uniref:Uncharacterized protein n=1 Tax=Rhododendron molle TaxID=49168 RepID=A0ACC0PZ44_RHOML|nr:hypothetical protein RHMOL_Rhmol01G0060400 [Rhododendron molle]